MKPNIKDAEALIKKYPEIDDYLQATNCIVEGNSFKGFQGDMNKRASYWYSCYNMICTKHFYTAGDQKEETIFEQMNRFVDSIEAEVKDENPSIVSIDFWLFKLRRRIQMLQDSHNKAITVKLNGSDIMQELDNAIHVFTTSYSEGPQIISINPATLKTLIEHCEKRVTFKCDGSNMKYAGIPVKENPEIPENNFIIE